MKTKILLPEEWGRLNGQMISDLLPHVEPHNAGIIVVEDEEGKIVGTLSVLRVTHFEGLWIDPEHRGKAGVLRALKRQAFKLAEVQGERFVLGGAENGDGKMDSICTRLNGRALNMRFYAMPVEV